MNGLERMSRWIREWMKLSWRDGCGQQGRSLGLCPGMCLSLRAWDAIISFKCVGSMSVCYTHGMDCLTQTEMCELLSDTQGDSVLQ